MIIGIYKPKGMTSSDVVMDVKRQTGEKKVGHAGTLDPLAKGVLVVGIGRESTKKLGEIVGKEKEYLAKIKLGETSTTDDEEGEKKVFEIKKRPTLELIANIIDMFVGKIKQVPPAFSAAKVSGKRAYKYAREGKQINLGTHDVEIKSIEILNYDWPYLELKVVTGSGVYIRSLARDIGEKLRTGGYLADLERTRVGEYIKENSKSLDDIIKLW